MNGIVAEAPAPRLLIPCVRAQDLKSAVKQALSLLPAHAFVGLITFGEHVYVHELGYEAMPKAVMLRGTAEIDGAKACRALPCSHCIQEAIAGRMCCHMCLLCVVMRQCISARLQHYSIRVCSPC